MFWNNLRAQSEFISLYVDTVSVELKLFYPSAIIAHTPVILNPTTEFRVSGYTRRHLLSWQPLPPAMIRQLVDGNTVSRLAMTDHIMATVTYNTVSSPSRRFDPPVALSS